MTKDDIIRTAREAGLQPYYDAQEPAIEAFANLVAAAEREACAKLCDQVQWEYGQYTFTARVSAERIRARRTT